MKLTELEQKRLDHLNRLNTATRRVMHCVLLSLFVGVVFFQFPGWERQMWTAVFVAVLFLGLAMMLFHLENESEDTFKVKRKDLLAKEAMPEPEAQP